MFRRRKKNRNGYCEREGAGKPESRDELLRVTRHAVTCVLAAQRLARELPWFGASVRDIRMLRIEDLNDLGPAIGNNA